VYRMRMMLQQAQSHGNDVAQVCCVVHHAENLPASEHVSARSPPYVTQQWLLAVSRLCKQSYVCCR
jgi:hypothetical protein